MVKKFITGPDGEPVAVHEIDIHEQVASLCEAFGFEAEHVIKIEIHPRTAYLHVANLSDEGSKRIVLDEDRNDFGLLDMRLERFSVKT